LTDPAIAPCAVAAFAAAAVALVAMSGKAPGMEFAETIQPMDLWHPNNRFHKSK
jgi:hypothetical protein